MVLLTVGLAVLVLAMVAVGLRVGAGAPPSDEVLEVDPITGKTVPPGGAVTRPSSSTTTSVPGATTTIVPPVDVTTPKIKVADADGRFTVTVPRTWLNVPTAQPDQNQWVPMAQLASGELGQTDYVFAVRWAATAGCDLERCANEVVEPLKAANPRITPVTTPDKVGGLPAIRIEVTVGDRRLVAWVVVQGDRYWVPQLRGPPEQFDLVLAVVRPVVDSMSFG